MPNAKSKTCFLLVTKAVKSQYFRIFADYLKKFA